MLKRFQYTIILPVVLPQSLLKLLIPLTMTSKSIPIVPLHAHASIIDAFGIDITLFTDVHWKK